MVTTPQAVATDDVYKTVSMCKKVNIPILGVVENMSWFIDTAGVRHELFGKGGGQAVADFAEAPLLGQIPLDPTVREWGDKGTPVVQAAPESADRPVVHGDRRAPRGADREGRRRRRRGRGARHRPQRRHGGEEAAADGEVAPERSRRRLSSPPASWRGGDLFIRPAVGPKLPPLMTASLAPGPYRRFGLSTMPGFPPRPGQPSRVYAYADDSARYGDIVRYQTGPIIIHLTRNPDHVKHVIQENHANYTKGRGLRKMRLLLGDGLLTSEGAHWRRQRKRCSRPFTASASPRSSGR